jgi:hypothetical protein
MILIPVFLGFQLALAFAGSDITLPLDLVIGGTIGLNTAYFTVNILQKRLTPKEEPYEPI